MRCSSRPRVVLLVATVTAICTSSFVIDFVASATPLSPPADFQRIVDDTGTVAISVPATWTMISTAPAVAADRTVNPSIFAARPAGVDAFPSLSVWVEPFRPDAAATDITWCTPTSQPYTQGDLSGQRTWFTNCEAGLLYQDIVVSPSSQVFTITLSFAYQSPDDEPTLEAIAGSLELLATEYPPPSATGPVGCFVRCHDDVAAVVPTAGVSPPPALGDPNASIWPYGPFWNVPQLGSEPVRGTGCGSQGQVGDVIPDGLWAGFVTNEGTPTIGIDLLCIYTGAAAQHVVSEGTANIVNDEPDYLVVNNNTRVRSAPAAPGIVLRDSLTVDGGCVENIATPHDPQPARQAWIRIDGGQVTWILWGCGFPAMPAAPPPANLPPAYPDYSDGVGSVWPYGSFRNVPQLGREPVRGSGCGASGQLGATIPDGLWAGFVTNFDAATNALAIDVLCIFEGDTAQAVVTEGTVIELINNEPDYLVINNNRQVRVMPSGLAAIITGEIAADGQCVEGTHHYPEAVDAIATRTGQQAWIRIDGGLVTWIFYGC
jgi:hypothetical protein